MARVYVFGVRTKPGVAMDLARQAAQRALALAPSLPEAQLAWAIVTLSADRDFAVAEAAFKRGGARPWERGHTLLLRATALILQCFLKYP